MTRDKLNVIIKILQIEGERVHWFKILWLTATCTKRALQHPRDHARVKRETFQGQRDSIVTREQQRPDKLTGLLHVFHTSWMLQNNTRERHKRLHKTHQQRIIRRTRQDNFCDIVGPAGDGVHRVREGLFGLIDQTNKLLRQKDTSPVHGESTEVRLFCAIGVSPGTNRMPHHLRERFTFVPPKQLRLIVE